ncbi:hypothetical protein BDP55DRAFT_722789 [Colletotrichum godetiae]|uniref:Uncharacterized protein n=1 Tax=Colletotrichum godetiae TaxID=1209918 RepID=A0AAJ0B093_9PEZI|nr:uncharacterized protein BDP55DRAFT_722789 [Colletotrichum godetiae]KAK1700219.1 hypothetical protein BDP55DRAFT_722789 [Colletotrichum godetiae]
MWLKDFLPVKMPQARIMVYGYDAVPAFRKSREGIQEWAINLLELLAMERDDEPDRPLVFLQAMTEANQNTRYEAIRNATYGMTFFGTPHNGSNLASLAYAVADIFGVVLGNPRPSFMEALRGNSLFADVVRDDFRHGLERFYVLSYYETIPPENMRGLVVDKKSAVLGLPSIQETPISLAGKDHSGLCKFSNERETAYRMVEYGMASLCAAAVADFHGTWKIPGHSWTQFGLQNDLKKVLEEVTSPQRGSAAVRKIFIFLDAPDEWDENDRKYSSGFEFFEDVVQEGMPLKICSSTRPRFSPTSKGSLIEMEDYNSEDVGQYLQKTIGNRDMNVSRRNILIENLRKKANHNFM